MSNLTPHDVDVRLTTTHNELVEEDTRLWEGLEDEKVSRIAGDKANNQLTLQVQNENAGTETRLSTEVIHRSEGDLSSITSLNALAAALSDYRIKTDLEIATEKIALQQLGVDLNTRVDYFVASWDHEQFLLYQAIQTVQADVNNKYSSMDVRIRKYENMLQDITTDSIQITMDNGEINMGAWTILSQAREWDLEILTKVSGYQDKTTVDLNQALEDLQNKLPIEQNIIDKAIEQLSKAPIIAKLDKSLSTNIGDVVKLQEALTQEALVRQQEILLQAQLDTERARALSQELKTDVLDVAAANADALAREASIRAEQLRLEALELAKVAEDLDAESQARIAAVLKEKADREAALAALVIDADSNLALVTTKIDQVRTDLDNTIESVGANITSIENKATGLENKLAVDVSSLKTKITAANKHVDDSVKALNLTITGVNTKADGITTKLTKETTNRIAAVKSVSDGLTSEITNRVAGDTANLNVINNYKLSNDTALANVQEQVTLNTTSNSANATKISALDVRLTTNDTTTAAANSLAATAVSKAETALTENTAQASQINGLNSSIESINGSLSTKADASALTALDTKVTNQGGLVTSQGTAITKLTNDLTALDTKTDTKASSSAVSALDSKVTSIDGRVTSQGASITTLTNRMTSAEGTLSKKAESSAVSALESKVTKQGLDITSQGSAITRINAAITATDLAVTKKADATALTTLDTKVTGIDGKLTTTSNAVTSLTGRVTTTEANILKKADASVLTNYYTKVEADDVTAGKISEYKAALSIGGVNQLKNSEAERTSKTASNKEYLLYESSPELKAFYNDNLNKDITISFDLKVAVAGPVQVYCSNKTFHTFSASINVAAANVDKWVRYVVTTQPRLHPTNTASLNSGLEFFGTYNTGRIPFLRKVQLEAGNVATDWSAGPRDIQTDLTANATAIQTTNTEVSRINGITVSNTSAITSLTGRIATAEKGLATKANASAVSSLTTRMTAAEGVNTSQGTSITKLTNDLATTNTELTTKASSAALSALDSKVTTQAGITTSQGSSITKLKNDLALTDAAVTKKAEATALSALDTKVTGQGNTLTSQGTAITKLTTDLSTLDTKVNTKANSTVVSSLDSKVTSIKGVVTSQGTSLTSLTNRVELAEGNINKKADSSAVTSLDSKVTKQGLDITSQGAAITRIDAAIDATNLAAATKASAAALSTLDSKVTSIDGKVSSNTSSITSLTGRVTATEGALTTKASVDAVNSLTTRIKTAEGTISSQATSITSLKSGLVTTNTNVTAAKTAANKANTLAGGKGKVFFQNAAPAVADRLVQNLWIDTTGNNNTPKRWLTNAWVAVNDKIATDALKAANAANVAIATKADASALSSLDSKVTSINGTVTSQGASITNLNTRLSSAEGTLTTKANSSAVSALDSKVTKQGNTITSQGTDITKLKADLALTNNAVSTKASSAALQSLDNRVVSIDGKVTTNASAITSLNGKMTTAEKGLATKLDASLISNYYTKTQANTATTGKIDEFKASLVIGGENLIGDSKAFRVGSAGGPELLRTVLANGNMQITRKDALAATSWFVGWQGAKTSFAPMITELRNNEEFTVTVWFRAVDVNKLPTAKPTLYLAAQLNYLEMNADLSALATGKEVPYTYTRKWNSAITGVTPHFNFSKASLGGGLVLTKWKIERGNVSTDWAEAAVDIQNKMDANATAISTTNTEVKRVNGVVVSQGTALTKLTGDLATTKGTLATKADGSALTALTNRVTSAEGVNTTQSSNITTLTNNLTTTNKNVATKANTSAVTALDSKVTGIDGRVTANTSSITSLSGRVTTTEKGLATKADTSAVTALTTRVGTVEGGLSSASSNITSLQAGLTATDLKATAALPRIAVNGTNKTFRDVLLYENKSAALLGNIVIQTPITFSAKMFNVNIHGYNYLTGSTVIDVDVGAYAHRGTSYINFGAINKGTLPIRVRLGVKNGCVCIILTSSLASLSWAYPKFSVDAEIGYTLAPDTWKDGWTASVILEANLADQGVTAIIQPPTVDVPATLTATATALTSTKAEVTRINGVVVSQGSSITTLQGNISTINGALATKAAGSAVSALTTRVTNAEGVNTTQSGQITTLTNNLSTTNGKVAKKAESSAVSNLDSKVTAVDGRVKTNSSLITSLSGRVTTTENNISTKADASALNKYYTIVQADKAITGKIDEFNASLVLGGVNILRDSDNLNVGSAPATLVREQLPNKSVKLTGSGSTWHSWSSSSLMNSPHGLVKGDDITVTLWLRAADKANVPSTVMPHLYLAGIDAVYRNDFKVVGDLSKGGLVRYVQKRKVTSGDANVGIPHMHWLVGSLAGGLIFEKWQIEKGTTPSEWSPSNLDTLSSLEANATAISTTNTEVSRVNGVVVNQGTQLTHLKATLTTLSGTLKTKANAAALTSLTTRVTNAEGVNTSQGSSITKLTNDLVTANTAINTKASSAAVATLDNKVTAVDGKVKTNASSITNLTGRITAAESGINTKADSTALTTLTNRVSTAEGKLTADASSITSLNSSLAKVTDAVTVQDTRTTNQPPSWYWTNHPKRIVNEFKQTVTIGVNLVLPGNTYCNLETNVYYSDSSGGALIQTATNPSDPSIYAQRTSVGTTAWTPWVQPIKDLRTSLTAKADASALTTLDTKVTSINGVVTSTASSLTTLQSTVGANTSAISVQGSAINGIKAEYAIKLDVNGLVSGIGLMNNGQSSAIAINADYFYVGSPTSNKKPFMINKNSVTIGGVTYPAGTWIDTALIANATIGTAHITNAAITNAKIANATIESAKIKDISADKITVGNPLVGPITQRMVTGTALTNVANLFNGVYHAAGAVATYGTGTKSSTSGVESSYIQIDLGSAVIAPSTYFFFKGQTGRKTYVKLKGSYNGIVWDYLIGSPTKWETIDDVPTPPGLTYDTVVNQCGYSSTGVKPYRYIRLYGNGSNHSTANELVGIMGTGSGGQTVIGSEGILTNSITADKISADAIEAISVAARSYTAYKNPSNPKGARTVVEGGTTTIYDDNGVERIFLGVR